MKIVILATTMRRGGAERVAAYIANYAAKIGHQVHLVVYDNQAPAYNLISKVKYIRISSGNKKGIKNIFRRIIDLRKLLKSIQPDIVLCFSILATLHAILSAPKRSFCIVGSERSNPYFRNYSTFKKNVVDIILRNADGLIFLTDGGKEYYSKYIQKKSIVIHNGLFVDDLPKPTNISEREKRICSVGRLSPVKNYPVILNAYKQFSQKHPQYVLEIYGDGSERINIQKMIVELGIEKGVYLKGEVSDVISEIYNCAMFVHASKSESWCNALLEALACGIPCVVADCDFGPRTMITNGVNGLLVSVDDVNALTTAMCSVIENPTIAIKLSENALSVRKDYDGEIVAKKYLEFSAKCIATKRGEII